MRGKVRESTGRPGVSPVREAARRLREYSKYKFTVNKKH